MSKEILRVHGRLVALTLGNDISSVELHTQKSVISLPDEYIALLGCREALAEFFFSGRHYMDTPQKLFDYGEVELTIEFVDGDE